jgi:hypothetical protein
MPHRIYRWTEVYFIRRPTHASARVLPLTIKALLVTLIELFLYYKPLAGRGEPGTWVTGQTGSQNR